MCTRLLDLEPRSARPLGSQVGAAWLTQSGQVSFFLLAGVAESWRMLTIAENPMNFTPGALGFDPLKLYEKRDEGGRRSLQLSEVVACISKPQPRSLAHMKQIFLCTNLFCIFIGVYLCTNLSFHRESALVMPERYWNWGDAALLPS